MTEDYKEKNFTLQYNPIMLEHFSIKNVFIYKRQDTEFPVKIVEVNENMICVERILCAAEDKIWITIWKESIEKYLFPILLTIDNVKIYLNIDFELDDCIEIVDRKDYYDKKTHQIRLTETNSYVNRGDITMNPCMFCHVDNNSYDTIGTADLMYIHEFQNFLASIGENIDWFKNE